MSARAIGALGVLVVLLTGCRGASPQALPKEAIKHRIRTQDGWELSLVEYSPSSPARGRPVLLLHGISANARNMDLDAAHSLARWMAAHGRHTWNLSLRGTGESDSADPAHGRKPGYSFDTLWKQDLTAAVAYVRQQTGASQIDFVGHSLGGLILYAYLAEGGEGIGAAVTLGSPLRLDWGLSIAPLVPLAAQLIDAQWRLPVASSASLLAPLGGQLPGDPAQVLIYNPQNVNAGTWQRLMASGSADISMGVPLQLAPLLRSGQFLSADGKVDYRRDMARIHTPVLVVAGKLDRVGMVPSVKDAYRALGGTREWLLLGEENGTRADYGHMDLLIGERASSEVFPKVLDFLERHADDAVSHGL